MGDKEGLYKGTIDCFIKTFRNDVSGPLLPGGSVSRPAELDKRLPVIRSHFVERTRPRLTPGLLIADAPTGSRCVLQGLHSQLRAPGIVERHHVPDPRAGNFIMRAGSSVIWLYDKLLALFLALSRSLAS